MLQGALVLFGWPAVVLGFTLAICGACLQRAVPSLLGVMAVLPMSWYLSGTPRFGVLAWLLPVLLAASALSVRCRQQAAAWMLLIAAAGFVAGLVRLIAG